MLQLEFVYYSQGRRVKKTVSTWNGSSFVQAGETLSLYDGWNLLAEIDSSSQSVIRSYTWGMDLSGGMLGAGGFGGLLSVEKGADVFLPSYDHNGNITAYSDASGSVVAEFEYDPFGRLLRETGDHTQDVVHRFSTKYQDEESGYYYYGFRYYDPETGRWLNRDPIEEQGGYNLYGFVGNNGMNEWDYNGLISLRPVLLHDGDAFAYATASYVRFKTQVGIILDASEHSGYVIQYVKMNRRIFSCSSGNEDTVERLDDYRYFEA